MSKGVVKVSDVRSVDAQLWQILEQRRQLIELQHKEQLVEALGDDLYEEGTVIRFKKTMPLARDSRNTREYTYAAVKAGSRWWVTGNRGTSDGRSWDDLRLFMVEGEYPVTWFEVMHTAVVVGETKS